MLRGTRVRRYLIGVAAALLAGDVAVAGHGDPGAPTLDPAGAVRVASARLDDGGVVAAIGPAVVVPVKEHGETIGVAFVGDGTASVAFSDVADAQRFANRQVIYGKRDPAELRAVAHGDSPYTTTVTRGFVFGSDEVLAPWLAGTPESGAEADPALVERLRELGEAEALDVGHRRRAPADQWLLADLFVADRLRYVHPIGGVADDDRWLSVYRDQVDGWSPADVLAIGRLEGDRVVERTVALGRWVEPAGEPSGPRIWDGIEAERVEASVRAEAVDARSQVALSVDATFALRAHRPIQELEITVPEVAATPGSWSVKALSLDGVDLELPDGLDGGATVRLPQPVPDGAEVRLRVAYVDTWALASGGANLGRASLPLPVLPAVRGVVPTDYVLTVGVSDDAKITAAQSGRTTREWDADGAHWVESTLDGAPRWPVVAFGDWTTLSAPAVQDLPELRVNLFRDEASTIQQFPPFLRTIVAYYQNLLPPFPTRELELLQERDDVGRFLWTARPGLVTLQQMQVFGGEAETRADEPHLEADVLAHEVAHQWWGSLVSPARSEDHWMSETLATTYACLFVAAMYGPKDCEVRQDTWRTRWEDGRDHLLDASLRDAPSQTAWVDIAYQYGPYVLLHMLRGRLGDDPFFRALDGYARDRTGRPATTDRLLAAFEQASGRDLHAFFAYWVVNGFVPALDLAIDGTQGTLTSDVPFGTLDVPVVATVDGQPRTVWVDVVDGRGTFTLPSRPTKVQLDPDGLVLARARHVSRR